MADTHPGDADALHDYWVHGKGAAQIRWGTEGAHTRCHRLLMEHAHMTSEQAWGYCQLAGHAATGKYSGEDKGKGHGRQEQVTAYTRSYPLEDISIRAGDGRVVDAYAAIFNVPTRIRDQDGDYEEIIDPTAFNRAIEHAQRAKGGWSIPVMYNHGMTIWKTPSERHSVPIGIPEEIRADTHGLFTRTRYHRSPIADEILEAIREGSISAYSFQGAFLRSDPLVPRGGFRPDRGGNIQTVRRTESTLREYGPTPFPAYAGAEVVGMRAEQVAMVLATLSGDERERLVAFLRTGTPLDPPAVDTPEQGSGSVAEDPPQAPAVRHSDRPPHLELQAQRAKFLIKYGGGRIGA